MRGSGGSGIGWPRRSPGGHPVEELGEALETGIATVVRAAVEGAAEAAYGCWARHQAGAPLLTDELARPAPGLGERVERLVRDWQGYVLELVRTEGASSGRGRGWRRTASTVPGWWSCSRCSPRPAGLTGAEVAVAGGTSVASQKVLEAMFGEQAVRGLARQARDELLARVHGLLRQDAGRYGDVLGAASALVSGGAARGRRSRSRRCCSERWLERLEALSSVVELGAGRLPDDVLTDCAAWTSGRAAGCGCPVSTPSSHWPERPAAASPRCSMRRRGAACRGRRSAADDFGSPRLLCSAPTAPRNCWTGWRSSPAARRRAAAPELSGLVLLDLPDHDSTEVSHRAEVDRLVRLVDAFVWVLDPQKYADAVLHDEYLRPLAAHRDVMVVALNQSDRLRRSRRLPGARPRPAAGRGRAGRRAGHGDVGGSPAGPHRCAHSSSRPSPTTGPVRRGSPPTWTDRLPGWPAGAAAPPEPDLRDAERQLRRRRWGGAACRLSSTRSGERTSGGVAAVGWPPLRWIDEAASGSVAALGTRRSSRGDEVLRRTSLPVGRRSPAREWTAPSARSPRRVARAAGALAAAAARRGGPSGAGTGRAGPGGRRRGPRDGPPTAVVAVAGAAQWALLAVAVTGGVWLGLLAVLAYLQIDLDPPSLGPSPGRRCCWSADSRWGWRSEC